MLDHARHVLGALVAGFVLLIAASSAEAEPTIAVEPAAVRAVWSVVTFTTSALSVECPVTLEGSFHSTTFTATSGLDVGSVTRASAAEGSCTGGRVRMLSETLPWRIKYESSTGTLPEISGIKLNVVGFALRGEASGLTCLYQSTESRPARATLEVRPQTIAVTGLRLDETAGIPLASREGFCVFAGEGRAAGTASVREAEGGGQANVAVVNDDAPLRFAPGSTITLPAGKTFEDVRIEATSNRTLGVLAIRSDRTGGDFHVGRGCDNQAIGVNVFCETTVSYTGGIANRGAYVEVPVNSLVRWIYIHRP